jgi:Sulfotransferase family
MRWTWPFNGRASNGQHKNGNGAGANGTRPDFLCVGLHKGGTTWLYQQLDSHPDFWMPPLKELHYFDQLSRVQRSSSPRCRDERDLRFLESINSLSAKPCIDFENYARLFEPKGPLLSGDISPNYSTLSNKVIRRIVRYFPKLKVIVLARDPVERVWSHLSMEVRYHQIEAFDVTDIDEVNRNLLRRGMLLRSYPSAVVARWKRYVHSDRFRIYFFDDARRQQLGRNGKTSAYGESSIASGSVLQERAKDLCGAAWRTSQKLAGPIRFFATLISLGLVGRQYQSFLLL